ncbi:MAG TPA: hypothetical protein VF699_04310, partial [Caulobacteraceae bacterium]
MSAHYKRYLSILAGTIVLAFAGAAAAGECCKPKPPCCAPKPPKPPKPPCCAPKPPAPPKFPNLNVNVVVNATAKAEATASARSEGGGDVFFGGGGSNIIATPGFPVIQALNVGHQARKAITETRKVTKKVFIRAVCIDDRGGAHGASQLFPEKDVRDGFRGEIYRCVAGSKLQVTYGETEAHGESLACSKGEALWYGEEKLECRAQTAQRNCFERSLLRRFGTGEKLVLISKSETY